MGISDAFGLLFCPLCNLVQKFQDLVRCEAIQGYFTEILAEPGKDRLICPNRIFFVNWTCGNPARVFLLV